MEEEIKKVVRQMILDGEITIKVESKDVGGRFNIYESKVLLSVKQMAMIVTNLQIKIFMTACCAKK